MHNNILRVVVFKIIGRFVMKMIRYLQYHLYRFYRLLRVSLRSFRLSYQPVGMLCGVIVFYDVSMMCASTKSVEVISPLTTLRVQERSQREKLEEASALFYARARREFEQKSVMLTVPLEAMVRCCLVQEEQWQKHMLLDEFNRQRQGWQQYHFDCLKYRVQQRLLGVFFVH